MARGDLLRYAVAQTLFYPTLSWNILLGRRLRLRNWWDPIDDHVLVGALPFARDVPQLAALGVRGVVNTCREYAGPTAAYEQHGIEQLWLPTIDFTSPTADDCRRAVDFIRRQAAAGAKVYVHCKAGRGRSATIAMAWLMAAEGLAPEAAQARLLARRPHVHRRLYLRPAVRKYWEEIASPTAPAVRDE